MQPLGVYHLSPDYPHTRYSSRFPPSYILLILGHSFVFHLLVFIDGQPLRTRLPSRQTLVHSPLCAPPSIDADTPILIIAHIRLTSSYFSHFLSFSRFSISAILPPLILLSLSHRVSLFSCCRYPRPSLLYLSTNTPHPSQMVPMSYLFASIHLHSIIHYTDIVPSLVLSYALCLETPLSLGRLLP